ncbi:Beta-ketoacyl synthase, C-terminal domain [Anaerosporobacter mobilis DSM 15930]|uniref:Beta-ketoacyl synthase, C-terminal domain n=1 Tax=Anaerosporobacter mobilis DSM 15930 TaxID=1120996 RepID=A0A1M7JEN1_9FIRM|nr:beta-ketoacyl synthase N-terminal-like domain-containing protein [Anaerosporobacter mobilis]SHM51550.1 Beta-ketoacyl synthase, C-terminal domain [Anaerosporobacter mobilis DSM 15930]
MIDEKELSKYILNEYKNGNIKKDIALELVKKVNYKDSKETDVAVIGMGCRFRKEDDYNLYWNGLENKKTWIDRCKLDRVYSFEKVLPEHCLDDIATHSKGSFIDNLFDFDYELFGLTKEEAKGMAPGQRIMLETAYRALEDAGYLGERLVQNKTGVYIGNNFLSELIVSHPALIMHNGIGGNEELYFNWSSGLATRISRQFNLRGPSYVLDLSCASSSMAILNGYQSLLDKKCDMVLIGGINVSYKPCIRVPGTDLIHEHENDIIQKPYDDNPGGSYLGEGAGALLLKPLRKALEDGDNIHAILKGGSIMNTGSEVGFLSSSAVSIKNMITDLFKKLDVNVESIGYIEGEGYAQRIEEIIQTSGINEAFKSLTNKKQFCAIGSMSPNVGYTQAAIGVLGAIKGILSMKNNIIPPIYHFMKPNTMFNFANSAFYINDIKKQWDRLENEKHSFAAYSFAYGGNNAFTVYEEAPVRDTKQFPQKEYLFVLTAKSQVAFKSNLNKFIEFLSGEVKSSLLDICYTAAVGRELYSEIRLAIVTSNIDELKNKLIEFAKNGTVTNSVYYGETNKKIENSKKSTVHIIDDQDRLASIASQFVQGEKYKFGNLYSESNARICPLPNYQFDRKRCCIFDDFTKNEKLMS